MAPFSFSLKPKVPRDDSKDAKARAAAVAATTAANNGKPVDEIDVLMFLSSERARDKREKEAMSKAETLVDTEIGVFEFLKEDNAAYEAATKTDENKAVNEVK
jgi:hypothetical protein